jgi:general L-amino acid transport system substrate-binding protein
MQIRLTLIALFLTSTLPAQTASQSAAHRAATTLARIRSANVLRCGLNTELAEYSNLDAHGNHAAFDVDLCKAVAVAVLGPNAHFTMTPFSDENDSLSALRSGTIDLLSTATPSIANLTGATVTFARPMLFDVQGLMVNRALNIHSARDLAGKKVCYLVETNIEINLQAYMQRQRIKFIPFPFQEEGEMEAAFITGNCAAITADVTMLAYERISFRKMAADFEVLPDVLAKDPLAPATRTDDPNFSDIVYAVSDALIHAEELGITQSNLEEKLKSPDTAVQRFLGVTPGTGKPLGLDDAWAVRAIQAVGNYGEIFDRTLGPNTPYRLDRGPNHLWTDGGLIISIAYP